MSFADAETILAQFYDDIHAKGAWDAAHADLRNAWRAAFSKALAAHRKSILNGHVLVAEAGRGWSASDLAHHLTEYLTACGLVDDEDEE